MREGRFFETLGAMFQSTPSMANPPPFEKRIDEPRGKQTV
jgi:hypothetical protein